jgi:hypothetical protein
VVLREFLDADAEMGRELSTDPYVPLVSTLPPSATEEQARAWVEPWITASLRSAERAGYQQEGLLGGCMEIGGRRRAMLVFAALHS